MSIVESSEQKKETAATLMIIGWICWFFGLLIMFFNPAAMHIERHGMLYSAVALALMGLLLNIAGYRMRLRSK